ncbi:MAG: hypothetical protein FD123_3599 [Bacteroidetes bacterium]|nr:MAG: hypothetical protein FD123_3599 [Bacteroidota bacterium]
MKKNILLIAYVFPPYPGIGGRRWAKMAKYLAKKGYAVHVITAANPFEENSLWTDDVKQEGIHVHEIPPHYPAVLLKSKLSIADKVRYRIWINRLKKKHRGSIYDRSLEWKEELYRAAFPLIRKHDIRHVISTGAPFRVLHYAVNLKEEFPSLKVIADFRDPWTSGRSYGFDNMTAEDRAVEEQLEKEVVERADAVLAPATEILDDLEKRYGHAHKFMHLPHAFDSEDFSAASAQPAFPPEIFSFAFAGTIYKGLENRLDKLAALLRKLKLEQPALYAKIRIDFYTNDSRHAVIFKDLPEAVQFFPPRPPRLLFAELKRYRFALILFTEQYKDYLSTKFWEFFYLRMPLIYIGPEGRVSEQIRSSDLGEAFTGADGEQKLLDFISAGGRNEFGYRIDTSAYSCENMTDKLETLLG